ncbi:AAA family ATPase [Anoxynatronum buryatiense]|uniref:AAA family ATPase n=1 Tax=Anoxynatronum buryatiense TaxID=489973 RepID=UPI0024B865B7|nr:AAA family ATPase [Anoxynatronum buryatiense]
MSQRIFLGKFTKKFDDQISGRYYAAGDQGNPWYGEVELGDQVFIAYEGKIIALWKAREYAKVRREGKEIGALLFDEVKIFDDVSVTNEFTRYKHFIHDLNLVNKITKSVKNLGFIPIKTSENCPLPEDIEFKDNLVDVYIALEETDAGFKAGDIRVVINNLDEMRINGVERFEDRVFHTYNEFNNLYLERNKVGERYTIKELNHYATQDNASQKKTFLTNVIDELREKGFFRVSNPITLYDNLLVGRRRSPVKTVNEKSPATGNGDAENMVDDETYGPFASLLQFNPNLILYGPPGTGKTYATEQIIDVFERHYYNENSGYGVAEAEGRVKNITFHQAYAYEEFIEGIRPVLEENEAGDKVGYRVENGLFKEHCMNAEKELIKRESNVGYVEKIRAGSAVWKVSLGDRKDTSVYNECLQDNHIAIGFLRGEDISEFSVEEIMEKLGDKSEYGGKPTQNANTINAFVNEMTVGDVVLVYDSPQTIRMMGVIKSDYQFQGDGHYPHRREVDWFKDLQYPINIHQYNGHKNLTMKTVYQLNRMDVSDIIEMIREQSPEQQSIEDKRFVKPYYMVIDEINRGNIAKIFGELITLIEQDKRGSMRCVLPYSRKEFSVPGNLYVIGTMNTADRSLATIDTALRRRFTFVEIEPDPNVLNNAGPLVNDTIDLAKLMDALNKRIEANYDRDHRIGHAYFMGIETLNSLYQTWYYRILPLLSEYFYNDATTLKTIAGNAFYDENGNVRHLSRGKGDSPYSPFEAALRSIYLEKPNA